MPSTHSKLSGVLGEREADDAEVISGGGVRGGEVAGFSIYLGLRGEGGKDGE